MILPLIIDHYTSIVEKIVIVAFFMLSIIYNSNVERKKSECRSNIFLFLCDFL